MPFHETKNLGLAHYQPGLLSIKKFLLDALNLFKSPVYIQICLFRVDKGIQGREVGGTLVGKLGSSIE